MHLGNYPRSFPSLQTDLCAGKTGASAWETSLFASGRVGDRETVKIQCAAAETGSGPAFPWEFKCDRLFDRAVSFSLTNDDQWPMINDQSANRANWASLSPESVGHRSSVIRRGPAEKETALAYLTRRSFMMRPETFQSCTYRLPSLSQDEPCVPLKTPSIHCSCGTL